MIILLGSALGAALMLPTAAFLSSSPDVYIEEHCEIDQLFTGKFLRFFAGLQNAEPVPYVIFIVLYLMCAVLVAIAFITGQIMIRLRRGNADLSC